LPDELEALAVSIRERELNVVGGFATHAHPDHLLWDPGFEDSPRWTSAKTAELAEMERPASVESLGEFPENLINLLGRVRAIAGHIPADSVPDDDPRMKNAGMTEAHAHLQLHLHEADAIS